MRPLNVSLFALLCMVALSFGTAACRSAKKSSPAKPTQRTRPKPPTDTDVAVQPTPTPKPAEPKPIEVEKGSKIKFLRSENRLMPVLEEATKQNRPVFVEFHASWCGPCKTLEREVFSMPEVEKFVNENYVAVKISLDSEDGKAVAQLYGVDKLPSMLFLNKKGTELLRVVGTTTPGRFIRSGADALDKNAAQK